MRKFLPVAWVLTGGIGLMWGHITMTDALLMFILAELQWPTDG